jgi:hypothetical protein
MSQVVQQEAITRLLVEKAILTKGDFLTTGRWSRVILKIDSKE